MAVHTSSASFLASIDRYQVKIKKADERCVAAAAFAMKTSVLSTFAAATGGDLVLSGFKRASAKVGVGYDIVKSANSTTAVVKARGPVGIIEKGARPHMIGRKGRGRNRSRVLVINGQPVTGPVRHPGMAGKKAWTRGVQAGMQPARAAARKAFHVTLVA
jgi:hypothetical protein